MQKHDSPKKQDARHSTTKAAPKADTNAAHPASPSPQPLVDHVLYLQRTIGNYQTQRLLRQQAPASPIPVHHSASPTIQRSLIGSAAALREVAKGGGLGSSWGKLISEVSAYEKAELGFKTSGNTKKVRASLELANNLLIGLEKLTRIWISDNQIATDTARTGGTDPTLSEKMAAAKSLLVRIKYEQKLLSQGDFSAWNAEGSFSDASLQASTDNAVGGQLNSLDQGTWQNKGPNASSTTGFFIKEKTHTDWNSPAATAIGLPQYDPNSAGRSLAMAKVDQLINSTIFIMTGGNVANSMLVPMHSAAHRRETTAGSGQFETKMGIVSEQASGQELRGGYINTGNITGDAAGKQAAPTALALDDPVLQRGLNKLQLLDAICGQVDRHLGNIYVKSDATGAVESVTGIDNDMAFGERHDDLGDQTMHQTLSQKAWRGMPPIADKEVADAIISIDSDTLEMALDGLIAPAEINATLFRFKQVKAFLAILPDNALIAHGEWLTRRTELAKTQTLKDSYLGEARKEATYAWMQHNAGRLVDGLRLSLVPEFPGTQIPGYISRNIYDHIENLIADNAIDISQIEGTFAQLGDALKKSVKAELAKGNQMGGTAVRDALQAITG